MYNVVIAPHADDETLGCGATLKKLKNNGEKIIWILVTKPSDSLNMSSEQLINRASAILAVQRAYEFDEFFELGFPAAELDKLSLSEIIGSAKKCLPNDGPMKIFAPFPGDAHSDHEVCFKVAASMSKWFRNKNFCGLYCYETLSETEFGIDPTKLCFKPNLFSDITKFIDFKLETMDLYESEVGKFPFPRSREAIASLARTRGVEAGCDFAEAFMLLRGYL